MSIKANGLTKFYGTQKAVDGLSFDIPTGQIVGFIGPNGAGKSTTMKMLTGYLPPSSGTAQINDLDIIEQSLEVRKRIGYLPEHNPLYTDMYVKEYLQYVAGIYKLGKNKLQRIDEIIDLTGLTKERKKPIAALSKGYRQRVGIAQALIHDPDVLILDEPTSGLDPNQIVEIRELISSVGRSKTILLSTHIMQEVEAICDRIIIISNGKLVADDSVKNIHKHGDNQQVVTVEFSKQVEQSALEQVEGIAKAVHVKDQIWIAEGDGSADIREKLFAYAVAQDIAVLSMQQKEKSLEEIFQELTK
jgi:ABC-2 type transport system ATP-binding protein